MSVAGPVIPSNLVALGLFSKSMSAYGLVGQTAGAA